jgi:hypothetical protein
LLLNNGAVFEEILPVILELLLMCCREKSHSELERRVLAIVTGNTATLGIAIASENMVMMRHRNVNSNGG